MIISLFPTFRRTMLSFALLALLFPIESFSYYEVIMNDAKPINVNDTKFINFNDLRLRKINKTHHNVNGDVNILHDIGNDFQLQVQQFVKTGEGYQPTAMHFGPFKACDFVQKEKLFVPAILEASNFPQNGSCPLKKNIYHINGFDFPLKYSPFHFEGDYMFEFRLLDDDADEIFNGYRIFATFILFEEQS